MGRWAITRRGLLVGAAGAGLLAAWPDAARASSGPAIIDCAGWGGGPAAGSSTSRRGGRCGSSCTTRRPRTSTTSPGRRPTGWGAASRTPHGRARLARLRAALHDQPRRVRAGGPAPEPGGAAQRPPAGGGRALHRAEPRVDRDRERGHLLGRGADRAAAGAAARAVRPCLRRTAPSTAGPKSPFPTISPCPAARSRCCRAFQAEHATEEVNGLIGRETWPLLTAPRRGAEGTGRRAAPTRRRAVLEGAPDRAGLLITRCGCRPSTASTGRRP